jgi:putative transposase
MGTVGDSYDNAMAESFWASLKRELVDWSHFATHAEARAAVFTWINWYNHERLHTSLQMQSPHDFEQTLTGQPLAA